MHEEQKYPSPLFKYKRANSHLNLEDIIFLGGVSAAVIVNITIVVFGD